MKSKINIPVGVALFVALALLAISAVVTLPQLSPSLLFAQQARMPLQPPTNLTAVTVGQTNIALVWTPTTTTTTTALGAVYMVERSADGLTGWDRVDAESDIMLGITTYNDNNVVNEDSPLKLNTTYYYRVSTTTETPARRSRPSNVDDATTGGVALPGAPDVDNSVVMAQGPSRIDLAGWTVPADNGGGAIAGYKIEYSDSEEDVDDVPANTWRVLVANTMSTDLTYTDNGSVAGLEAEERRHYRVSAINSAGAGMAAYLGSAVTLVTAIAPTSAPTGLMARAMGPTQIRLSWTAPTETNGDEITGYQIEYSGLDPNGAWVVWADLLVVTGTGDDDTTYTDDGTDYRDSGTPPLALLAETTRYYRVSAINAAAANSAPSNVAYATTAEATVPGKPEAPTLMLGTGVLAQQITVTWSAPTDIGGTPMIAGYRIERSGSASSWPTDALVPDTADIASRIMTDSVDGSFSYTDTSVPKDNTRWYYRVSAINTVGTGARSDAANAVTPPASVLPDAPTDLMAWENGSTRIVLHWKAPVITGGGNHGLQD